MPAIEQPETSSAPSRVAASGKRRYKAKASEGEKRFACGKCGAVGFNARGCGKSHNVASAVTPESPKPTPKPTTKPSKPSVITGRAAAILERTRAARRDENLGGDA